MEPHGVLIMVKMNWVDGLHAGLGIEESCDIAAAFAGDNGTDILAVSGSLILENGLYMLCAGKAPLLGAMIRAQQPSFLKKLALTISGPFFVPKIPFWHCASSSVVDKEFLQTAGEAGSRKNRVSVGMIGGVSTYKSLHGAVVEVRFDLVQSGRAILRDPNIVRRWAAWSNKVAESKNLIDKRTFPLYLVQYVHRRCYHEARTIIMCGC
jgi:hypothetical protein